MEIEILTALVLIQLIVFISWLISLQDQVSKLREQVGKGVLFPQQPSQATVTPSPAEQPANVIPEQPTAVMQPGLPAEKTEKEPTNWVSVFSWIGGFTLLLGIAFWIKYALENNLISPATRIVSSLAVGFILWGVGAWMKKENSRTTAATLCASGLCIHYIAYFSAYYFYHMIQLPVAFGLMALVALGAFATAAWKKAPYINVLAQIIGFLTPFLFSSSEPNFIFFFTYTFFIACAASAASIWCKWEKQLNLCAVFTGICLLISFVHLSAGNIHTVFTFSFACCVLFGIGTWLTANGTPFVLAAAANMLAQLIYLCTFIGSSHNDPYATGFIIWNCASLFFFALPVFGIKGKFWTLRTMWAAAALVGLTSGFCAYQTLVQIDAAGQGGCLLAFAVLYGIATYYIYEQEGDESEIQRFRLMWFGAVALFFLTYALAVLLDNEVLTIALALEGCALVWLNTKLHFDKAAKLGKWLLVITAIRLLLNPEIVSYHASNIKILNWILYTYFVCGAAMFTAAKLWEPKENKSTIHFLQVLGGILWFALINLEIADFFTDPGANLNIDLISPARAAATYTIVWMICAAGCLFASLQKKSAGLKKAGLILSGMVLGKLFLCDIWKLPTGARILVLISVAGLLIGISYLYQQLKKGIPPDLVD